MSWKVLVSAPYFQPVIEQFRHVFDDNGIELVVPPVNERMSEEELLEWIGDIDGVIGGDDRFTAAVMERAGKLKVISKWGTGIDSIDGEAAARLGIAVRNTPNAFTEPVSDSAMGYILAFARKLPWMDRDIRAGEWVKRPGISMSEAVLGIVGVGDIGRAVARKARGFGMKMLGVDPVRPPEDFLADTGMELTDFDSILQRADFISLHCTLNETSRHIIDRAALDRMKPTACLVNTARGPLIDEAALAEALAEGAIGGAGMDVFEVEPLPADSPLRRLDNCLLAPHNSNSSPIAWERVHRTTLSNLLEELRKEGP